jgi:hypothetical protein
MSSAPASWVKFQFQWVEWESGALTGQQLLATTQVAPMWYGDFSAGEEWPNPVQSYTQTGTPGSTGGTAQASLTVPTITSNNP